MELVSNFEIGRLVRLGAAEDKSRAEGKPLGSQASVGDTGEAFVFLGSKVNASRFAGHAEASVLRGRAAENNKGKGSFLWQDPQGVICTRMFTLNPITCGTHD
jgi:hypothetical protein